MADRCLKRMGPGMDLPLLRSSLQAAPTVEVNGYTYFVHPITDGVPPLSPTLLNEVVEALDETLPKESDKIVGVEAMGLPVAVALSIKRDIPLVVVRKRRYGLPGEVEVVQRTGYGNGKLYINGISPDDQVVVVDDVLSTGGTLDAILGGILEMGASVLAVGVVVDKSEKDVVRSLKLKYELPLHSLIRVKVDEEGLTLLS